MPSRQPNRWEWGCPTRTLAGRRTVWSKRRNRVTTRAEAGTYHRSAVPQERRVAGSAWQAEGAPRMRIARRG